MKYLKQKKKYILSRMKVKQVDPTDLSRLGYGKLGSFILT